MRFEWEKNLEKFHVKISNCDSRKIENSFWSKQRYFDLITVFWFFQSSDKYFSIYTRSEAFSTHWNCNSDRLHSELVNDCDTFRPLTLWLILRLPNLHEVHSASMLLIIRKHARKCKMETSWNIFMLMLFATLSPWSVRTLMKGYDIETNENLPPRQRKDSSGFEKKNIRKEEKLFSSGIFTSTENYEQRKSSGNGQTFHSSTLIFIKVQCCNNLHNRKWDNESTWWLEVVREWNKKLINKWEKLIIDIDSRSFVESTKILLKNFFEFLLKMMSSGSNRMKN